MLFEIKEVMYPLSYTVRFHWLHYLIRGTPLINTILIAVSKDAT